MELVNSIQKAIILTNGIKIPTFSPVPSQLLIKSGQAALGIFMQMLGHSAHAISYVTRNTFCNDTREAYFKASRTAFQSAGKTGVFSFTLICSLIVASVISALNKDKLDPKPSFRNASTTTTVTTSPTIPTTFVHNQYNDHSSNSTSTKSDTSSSSSSPIHIEQKEEEEEEYDHSTISPQEKLEQAKSSFFRQFATSLKFEEMEALIQKGDQIYASFNQLKDSDFEAYKHSQSIQEAEINCVALIWYFMWEAHQKGEAFQEGAFIVDDSKGRFFELFKLTGFIRFFGSSHLKAEKVSEHYGFDPKASLPEGKRHVLFIPLNSGSLYLKPENFSTSLFDAPAHGLEFIFAQMRKATPYVNSVPLLGSTYKLLVGTDQDHGMRKERIPKPLLTEFTKLVQGLGNSEQACNLAKQECSGGGIGAMFNYINTLLLKEQELSAVKTVELKNFRAALIEKYGEVGLVDRIGEEVHIKVKTPPNSPAFIEK